MLQTESFSTAGLAYLSDTLGINGDVRSDKGLRLDSQLATTLTKYRKPSYHYYWREEVRLEMDEKKSMGNVYRRDATLITS
jgi:hypothetical protein